MRDKSLQLSFATKEDSYIKSDESFCAYDGQLLVFSSMKSSG